MVIVTILDGYSINQKDNRICSITTGLVKENWNEDYPGKIKVELFLGEEGKNVTGWIPVATWYGGKEFGAYALPEIESEVIVAFLLGDRNCPVVIGSLWNLKNTIPSNIANESNTIKCIRTKGGCEILFEEQEEKEKIVIQTPKKLLLSIEDEKKTISMQDENGENKIVLDAENGALTLLAKSKLELQLNGNVVLSFDNNSKTATLKMDQIKVEASQGLELKGQNSKVEGSMLQLSAQSSLKIESSAIAELKGSMVKIN